MQVKKISVSIFVLIVLAVGLAPSAFSQKAQSPFRPQQRELGYYDRTTGAFTPVKPQAVDDAEPAATTTVTGEFVFTIAITVKSAIPPHAVIGCDASAIVDDAVTGLGYEEHGSAVATGSGTTWTCKVTIPYSWTLGSPTTADQVTLDYDVSMVEGYQATATNGTGTIVEGIPLRTTGHGLGTIKLPVSGAITNEAVAATI